MEVTPPSQDTVSLSDITASTIVDDRELEMLIIASIQTLKQGNKNVVKMRSLNP